jgi:hypothetical protein
MKAPLISKETQEDRLIQDEANDHNYLQEQGRNRDNQSEGSEKVNLGKLLPQVRLFGLREVEYEIYDQKSCQANRCLAEESPEPY